MNPLFKLTGFLFGKASHRPPGNNSNAEQENIEFSSAFQEIL